MMQLAQASEFIICLLYLLTEPQPDCRPWIDNTTLCAWLQHHHHLLLNLKCILNAWCGNDPVDTKWFQRLFGLQVMFFIYVVIFINWTLSLIVELDCDLCDLIAQPDDNAASGKCFCVSFYDWIVFF